MVCKQCGAEFEPNRSWQKFCTTKCKTDYHNAKKLDNVIKFENEDDKAVLDEFCQQAEDDPSMWVEFIEELRKMTK